MTQSRNYWVVAPYASGDDWKPEWIAFAKTGYACMGWDRESGKAPGFHDEMKGRDVVILAAGRNAKKTVFGVGIVEQGSKCEYDKLDGMPCKAYYRKLVSFITEKKVLDQLTWNSGSAWGDAPIPHAIYDLRPNKNPTDKRNIDLLDNIFQMEEIKNLLLENKNLILTGAPGTGKTYSAKQIAAEITGENKEAVGFVQFHPSYDYTDFVEGLRPTKPDEKGNIGFRLVDGVFKQFCKAAKRDCVYNQEDKYDEEKSKKFVFIIDEINRGEISKIFGELFFSIDPDYRGKKGGVKTQYTNMHDNLYEEFYVPENVYIIGTMNDIDRNVESFDFAMQRRFVWKEITAQNSQNMLTEEVIKKMVSQTLDSEQLIKWKEKVIEKMKALNDTIYKDKDNHIEGLNSSYHIGAAYFLKLKPDENGEPNFSKLWDLRLKPLLSEYLRGIPNADENMKKLKGAFLQEFSNENNR